MFVFLNYIQTTRQFQLFVESFFLPFQTQFKSVKSHSKLFFIVITSKVVTFVSKLTTFSVSLAIGSIKLTFVSNYLKRSIVCPPLLRITPLFVFSVFINNFYAKLVNLFLCSSPTILLFVFAIFSTRFIKPPN